MSKPHPRKGVVYWAQLTDVAVDDQLVKLLFTT